MTDPDCHNCQPHDPGQDLRDAILVGLAALAVTLAIPAVALIAGTG